MPLLSAHFEKLGVTVNLFSTEWIMSMFLSCIPIELTNIYLDLFFESGWLIMYGVAIEVLRYFQSELLSKKDAGDVIGQIKQARRGCEHLLAIQLESTQSSSRKTNRIRIKRTGMARDTHQSNYRTNLHHEMKVKLMNSAQKQLKYSEELFPENFKETLFEDSKPESPQILMKKASKQDDWSSTTKKYEILSDEILDDVSVLTSDLDENLQSGNHKMWSTILMQVQAERRQYYGKSYMSHSFQN